MNVGKQTTTFNLGGRTYQPVGTKIYNNLIFSHAGTMFHETDAVIQAPDQERAVYKGNMLSGNAPISNNPLVDREMTKQELHLVRVWTASSDYPFIARPLTRLAPFVARTTWMDSFGISRTWVQMSMPQVNSGPILRSLPVMSAPTPG